MFRAELYSPEPWNELLETMASPLEVSEGLPTLFESAGRCSRCDSRKVSLEEPHETHKDYLICDAFCAECDAFCGVAKVLLWDGIFSSEDFEQLAMRCRVYA